MIKNEKWITFGRQIGKIRQIIIDALDYLFNALGLISAIFPTVHIDYIVGVATPGEGRNKQ